MMIVCRVCNEKKNDREFFPDGNGGIRTDCAACNRRRSRERYYHDPEVRETKIAQAKARYARLRNRAA